MAHRVYWTPTVMSTLGFGDITFHWDLGRAFSLLVWLSGIVLLLIVLPLAFIRHFYAPWLEPARGARALASPTGCVSLFAVRPIPEFSDSSVMA